MITDWRKYHRNYWRKRRKDIINYLGGKCVECGGTNELEVDHIDRTTKSFNISYRCSLNQIKDELAKCQLLCKKHHKEKTAKEQSTGATHGMMYAWMKLKCKCKLCLTAKDEWNTIRKLKRGAPVRGHYKTKATVVQQAGDK